MGLPTKTHSALILPLHLVRGVPCSIFEHTGEVERHAADPVAVILAFP